MIVFILAAPKRLVRGEDRIKYKLDMHIFVCLEFSRSCSVSQLVSWRSDFFFFDGDAQELICLSQVQWPFGMKV